MPPKSSSAKSNRQSKRRPLKGRTILVTQAEPQAKRFSSLLKQRGARVLTCPTIEVVPLALSETCAVLDRVDTFDWLVFMSQNAVVYFFEQLKKVKIPKSKLKGRRIAAMGKTTREALKQNQLRVHLVPSVFQSEYLANSFKGRIEGKRFLILSALNGRTVLSDTLQKKGAIVETLPLYKTLIPKGNSRLLKKYICEERIDAITFTSPSTVNNFMNMLQPDRHFRRYLETLTIATLGEVTAQAVEMRGLRVRVKPSEFTIPAFVNTLSREL